MQGGMGMDRAAMNDFCATLPGAAVSEPFGPGLDVWKVGTKMFAIVGMRNKGVSLKCETPDTAALLIDVGRAEKAPYLPRGGWVLIPWGRMEDAELKERLITSYRTIRKTLTKKQQTALPPFPQSPPET